jgi:predicted DCC family thiol-disulfide oxidoreductase YuxK
MGSPGSLETREPILILFDGVCNLCNGLVRFIIKRDPSGKFKFASLQSDFGRSQLLRFGFRPDLLYSLIVIDNGTAMDRSDAAFHIAERIGSPWKYFSVFKILPKVVRDAIYSMVAGSRYKVFGKRDSCVIPGPDLKDRFVQ